MIQVIFCYGYHLPSICIRNTTLLFLVLRNTGLFVPCTSICAICEIQTGVSNDETCLCIVTSYLRYQEIKLFHGIGLLQSNLWWRLKVKNTKYLSTENAQIYLHDMHHYVQPNLFIRPADWKGSRHIPGMTLLTYGNIFWTKIQTSQYVSIPIAISSWIYLQVTLP